MQDIEIVVIRSHPLLTIAIPTYNRADYLALCMEKIGDEIDSLNKDQQCLVKLYVSDNASSDKTPDVIAHYRKRHTGAFEVVRNIENIGADKNIAQCYGAATTPYVWIMGDDDVILSGGLKKVLDVLVNDEVDILYVNNYWFNESYTDKPKLNKNHGTSSYISSLAFSRYTNVMLTFISGQIVRSGVGLNYQNQLMASNLVQLSWVLPLMREGKRFAVIQDWVVAAKGSNSGGYGLVKVFGSNLVKITNDLLQGKPEIARAIQNGTIVNFFPGFIFEFRKGASKFSDQDMSAGLKEAFGDNWRYYVFLAPLMWLPLFAANYYNVLLKVFRRLFRSVLV